MHDAHVASMQVRAHCAGRVVLSRASSCISCVFVWSPYLPQMNYGIPMSKEAAEANRLKLLRAQMFESMLAGKGDADAASASGSDSRCVLRLPVRVYI